MITSEILARVGWYCLRSRARGEQVAAAALTQRVGVEVFAPRIRTPRSGPAGRCAASAEPLFPGYLFARFQYPHQLRHVISCRGVAGLVQFGGEPPVVADGVIEFLRAQVRGFVGPAATPVLEEGTWVKVVSGSFRNVEGRVLPSSHRTDRVRLLLSLLGREVQVSVLAEQVVPHAARFAAGCPPGLRAGCEHAAPFA